MTPATAARFFDRLAAASPDPKGELDYSNPFTLLVAVVLSAQATDVGVNRATRGLFAAADTPAAMLALGEEGVRRHIRTIGLFNAKARNVIALSRILVEEHGGTVPPDRDALERLPGVGRKTANVVMNIAFGAPTIAVDTHIFRIGNRTGLAPGRTPRAVEDALMRIVPPERLLHAHHWLILHGRYVCKARRPDCDRCVVADLCAWPGKTAAAAAGLSEAADPPPALPPDPSSGPPAGPENGTEDGPEDGKARQRRVRRAARPAVPPPVGRRGRAPVR